MVAADRNVAARDVGNEDSGGRSGGQKERDVRARDVTELPFNIAYPSELTASQAFANFYRMPLTKPLRRDTRWDPIPSVTVMLCTHVLPRVRYR